jgi:hypothetical protein
MQRLGFEDSEVATIGGGEGTQPREGEGLEGGLEEEVGLIGFVAAIECACQAWEWRKHPEVGSRRVGCGSF